MWLCVDYFSVPLIHSHSTTRVKWSVLQMFTAAATSAVFLANKCFPSSMLYRASPARVLWTVPCGAVPSRKNLLRILGEPLDREFVRDPGVLDRPHTKQRTAVAIVLFDRVALPDPQGLGGSGGGCRRFALALGTTAGGGCASLQCRVGNVTVGGQKLDKAYLSRLELLVEFLVGYRRFVDGARVESREFSPAVVKGESVEGGDLVSLPCFLGLFRQGREWLERGRSRCCDDERGGRD
mmetsp:Transcript_9807/g.23107  ORF Transcript_9807/g.23107 Transcript_9807/m.23107 type:complete len:238 (-) Transcript_9807:333-1046(-)